MGKPWRLEDSRVPSSQEFFSEALTPKESPTMMQAAEDFLVEEIFFRRFEQVVSSAQRTGHDFRRANDFMRAAFQKTIEGIDPKDHAPYYERFNTMLNAATLHVTLARKNRK